MPRAPASARPPGRGVGADRRRCLDGRSAGVHLWLRHAVRPRSDRGRAAGGHLRAGTLHCQRHRQLRSVFRVRGVGIHRGGGRWCHRSPGRRGSPGHRGGGRLGPGLGDHRILRTEQWDRARRHLHEDGGDPSIKVLTTSWGQCEGAGGINPSEQQAETTLFDQAASQGQTVMAAAGDSGSSDCYAPPHDVNQALSVDDPADQPDVTGVGGTTLPARTRPPTESVWNGGPGLGAGGGGNSADFARRRGSRSPRPRATRRCSPAGRGANNAEKCPTCRRRPTPTAATSSSSTGSGSGSGAPPRRHPCGPPSPQCPTKDAPPLPDSSTNSSMPPGPGPSHHSMTSPSGTTISSIRVPALVCALSGRRPL